MIELVTSSKLTKQVFEKLPLLSEKELDILVTGEEGVGKTRFLEELNGTNDLLKLNSENFFNDLEIFFQAKTLKSKKSIIIDRIEELDTASQSLVYKFLETRTIQFSDKEVGGITSFYFTSRLSLDELGLKKIIREDLLKRISVIRIHIPPLRERKEDIPELTNQLILFFTKKYKKKITKITEPLAEFLLSSPWFGNITELSNLLSTLVLFANSTVLDIKQVPKTYLKESKELFSKKIEVTPGVNLAQYEKEIIRVNLELQNGNRERTAEILKISTRNLYRKIKEYDL
ncbi:MAG: helix-turn-helix domain-containing protein [Leptospiraceae bacterium]|nr:helix-turn-helix domain-containing protein [Leptospiraceae bacterium]